MNCLKKIKNSELLELIAWGRGELSRVGIEEAAGWILLEAKIILGPRVITDAAVVRDALRA